MKRFLFLALLVVLAACTSCSFIQVGFQTPAVQDTGSGKEIEAATIELPMLVTERMLFPQSCSRSIINLKEALTKYSPIRATLPGQVRLGDEKLMNYPFVCLIADKSFESTPEERANLANYLRNGGFILLENARAEHENNEVEATFRKLIRDSLGSVRFEILQNSHEIYHTVFDFDKPPIGVENKAVITSTKITKEGPVDIGVLNKSVHYLEGVYLNGRLVCVLSNKGYCVKWNEYSNNEPQLKMGVNIVAYALANNK